MTENEQARSDWMHLKMWQSADRAGRTMPSLQDYLTGCAEFHAIDHTVRSQGLSFYIHPAGVSGPTVDFQFMPDGSMACTHASSPDERMGGWRELRERIEARKVPAEKDSKA